MKLLKTFVLILAVNFCLLQSVHALPTITTVLLDATGSISESDFRLENQAAESILTNLYEGNKINPNIDQPEDYFTVAWFGGYNQYQQGPYITTSDYYRYNMLRTQLKRVQHPKYDKTAIYSALSLAAVQLYFQEMKLGKKCLKVIHLVTDGQDNASPFEAKKTIVSNFPNTEFRIHIIGVGPDASITEFSQIAEQVTHINDYANVGGTIILYHNQLKNQPEPGNTRANKSRLHITPEMEKKMFDEFIGKFK